MTLRRRRLLSAAARAAAFCAGASALSVCGLAPPLVDRARRVPQVGYLAIEGGPGGNPYVGAFRQGLRELGWIEGENIAIHYQLAQGRSERVPELAADLAERELDLIVAFRDLPTRAAKQAMPTRPIVSVGASDPVGTGLVASLARPGGNLTGLTLLSPELAPKRLELLRDLVPDLRRVGAVWNSGSPDTSKAFRETVVSAPELGLQLTPLEVRAATDLSGAFQKARRERVGAVLVLLDSLTLANHELVGFLAAENRLPAAYEVREFVDAGGLISYGPSFLSLHRRAAAYVDKITKGADPTDLPVERPTRLELVLNLRTAREIGLSVPAAISATADEVLF